jgi:hypothetical protein
MPKKEGFDQVKQLIDLGKEKGFLTYDEVNDLLPPEVINGDQIDNIVIMFGEEERLSMIGARASAAQPSTGEPGTHRSSQMDSASRAPRRSSVRGAAPPVK